MTEPVGYPAANLRRRLHELEMAAVRYQGVMERLHRLEEQLAPILHELEATSLEVERGPERKNGPAPMEGLPGAMTFDASQWGPILERVSDGLIVYDLAGEILFANDAGARYLGFQTGAALVQAGIAGVLANVQLQDEAGTVTSAKGSPAHRSLQDGLETQGLFTIRSMAAETETRAYILGLLLRDAAGRVQYAADILKPPESSGREPRVQGPLTSVDLDVLKARLLSVVSHELRTPLTVIKGFSTTLLDYYDKLEDEAKVGFLAEIDTAADRLKGLIDNLLEYSRLDAGLLLIEPTLNPLDELVQEAIGRFRDEAKGRKVNVNVAGDLGLVNVDPRRFVTVMGNLLANAHKHAPPDSAIWVGGGRGVDGGRSVAIVSVRDDGPGIPEANQALIFEPFRLGSGSATSAGAGVGLGLAICRKIIDAHHGRIWVESVPGRGATFRVALPLE